MISQQRELATPHRFTTDSGGKPGLARPGLARLLCTGLALQGCASLLPNETYEPVAPPAFAAAQAGLEQQPPANTPGDQQSAHTLPEWVGYALQNNPRITAAIAQYEAALNQVPRVTALPDPKLSYRYFLEAVETRVGAQQYAVGISQQLPWLGKLRTQGAAASQQAHAAAARVAATQNEIIADVARAWYELYYLNRSLDILRTNRDLVAHLERVARARYGSGVSDHADVIRTQVELGKIENELASLADRQAPLLARFNATLSRASNAPVQLPDSAAVVPINAEDAAVLQRVAENNPTLQALAFDIAAASAARERASRDFYPDFSVGIDYIATDRARSPNVAGSGDDPLAAAFTMTLPIQRGSYRAGVRAAEAGIAGVQARRDEQLNRLQAETVTALFRLRDAERQIDLYRDNLLPRANESLVATQRAYSTGAASFTDLIDAQRVLLTFELAGVRAITDHNLARTTLEELTGAALSSADHLGEQPDER